MMDISKSCIVKFYNRNSSVKIKDIVFKNEYFFEIDYSIRFFQLIIVMQNNNNKNFHMFNDIDAYYKNTTY